MKQQITLSIATVPDIGALRSIHKLEGLSNEDVLSAVLHLHQQKHGHRVLPLYQQQIVSLAFVGQARNGEISVNCLGNSNDDDRELLKQFEQLIGDNAKIITWDIHTLKPLINYRLLKHGLSSKNYYDAQIFGLVGEFSDASSLASTNLAGLSGSLSLPSSVMPSQEKCIEYYLSNQLETVHHATQIDALNTYLIALKYQLVKAEITTNEYFHCCERFRAELKQSSSAVLKQYESEWHA